MIRLSKHERDRIDNEITEFEEDLIPLLKRAYATTENEVVKDMLHNDFGSGILDYINTTLQLDKDALYINNQLYGEG